MASPLRVRVLFLQNQIQELNELLTTHQHSTVDRDEIVTHIQLLTRGLNSYREALRIEEAFRRTNPRPNQNPAKPDWVSSPSQLNRGPAGPRFLTAKPIYVRS